MVNEKRSRRIKEIPGNPLLSLLSLLFIHIYILKNILSGLGGSYGINNKGNRDNGLPGMSQIKIYTTIELR